MKRLLILTLLTMTSALYAQTLFVESDNAAVTGAVTAELMMELRTNDNRPLRGNGFICHQVDGQYIIAIDLHSYRGNIITTTIYDILKTKPYWVNNLKMNLNRGDFIDEIHLTYTLNGRTYPVMIYIGFPG